MDLSGRGSGRGTAASARTCGWAKNSSGGACSTISPRSMKITRSATARAKPISCVTQSIVMPSRASATIVSSTSLTISGSSADVGSSNSMIRGAMHSARAIATRCCWPPESWPGYLRAWSAIRTRSRNLIAVASASARGCFFTQIGASVQFSSTVRCGNRLKCWNTMPMSLRTASMFFSESSSVMPSTITVPCSCVSSRLRQRISVDLPEPDGPQTTMRSPRFTVSEMSRSTWKSPNHLFRPSMRMMSSASGATTCAVLSIGGPCVSVRGKGASPATGCNGSSRSRTPSTRPSRTGRPRRSSAASGGR